MTANEWEACRDATSSSGPSAVAAGERHARSGRAWRRPAALLIAGLAALGVGDGLPPQARGAGRAGAPGMEKDELAEAQIKLAQQALRSIDQRVNAGIGLAGRDHMTALWSRRLLIAQLEASDDDDEVIPYFEAHHARMRDVQARAKVQYRERRISDLEQFELEYFTRESQLWEQRVKAGRPPWGVWGVRFWLKE